MSLSSDMFGNDIPHNDVKLPSERYRRVFDRDFTLREIKCKTCDSVLAALLIAEEHEADFVWPFDVICEAAEHRLVPRGTEGAAQLVCHGRPIQEWEAKKYLEKYR